MLLCQIFWLTRSHFPANQQQFSDDISIFTLYLEIGAGLMFVIIYKEEVKSRHFKDFLLHILIQLTIGK